MDPVMQNYLLAAGAGAVNNNHFSVPTLTGQPSNESNNNSLGNENANGALDYQTLMRSYLLQQQQQQQQQNQAAAAQAMSTYANPNLALLGADSLSTSNNAFGNLVSAAGPNFLHQRFANLDQRNPSTVTSDYMDANRMLLQRLQGGQQQQEMQQQQLQLQQHHHHQQQQQQQQQQQLQQQNYSLMGDTTSGGGDNAEAYGDNGILGPWSSTSAGLLGKMAAHTLDKGKKARKKPKDKPKRPLSAYNIFFREERLRILDTIHKNVDEIKKEDGDEEANVAGKSRKRKKRAHGKIGSENLAKVIGQRWQSLEPEKVVYYKKKAEEDMKRYKDQMEEYLAKQNQVKMKMENSINGDLNEITNPSAKRIKLDY